MRIRKRLSGCLPKQLPSYKYCFATGWLRAPAPGHEGGEKSIRCEAGDECKHPIGGGGEAIGEEPRTPPPCYGEKPALPRHKELLHHRQHERRRQHEAEQEERVNHRRSSAGGSSSSPGVELSRKKAKRRRSRDQVKGESSSSQRKRVRVQQQHHDHLRDPAEASNKRSSHENCGPDQRLDTNEEFGAKSISYQQEISRMDPLSRAMHTVVSEAGIEGLTARETAQQILNRGLCSEADIPRSVKMAKAMRESPYLVEISRSSKFVLWSTFLEESSKNLASENHQNHQQVQEQQQQACRRRRRQRAPKSNTGNIEGDQIDQVDETGVAYQILELRMGGSSPLHRDDHHQNHLHHLLHQQQQQQQQLNGVIKQSPPAAPPAPAIQITSTPENHLTGIKPGSSSSEVAASGQGPRKFFLDLNMAPQDDW